MNYLQTLLGTTLLLLATVATLNWAVDPAGIFRPASFGQKYARELVGSTHGLVAPDGVDEREFKVALAKYVAADDCVVIGSSHVMQIGSARRHRAFPQCRRVLNLGVSGAAIEDHITLTWLALAQRRPSRLILGVDPWTFAYGKDERWKLRYAETYRIASAAIAGSGRPDGGAATGFRDLLSAEYTRRSLSHLMSRKPLATIAAAAAVDEEVGGPAAITLPDGSRIYAAEYIAKGRRTPVPAGGGEAYKIAGALNEASAIAAYRGLLRWIRAQGVKPVLLMTPYHPNVWLLEASPTVRAMRETEQQVRALAAELAVPVIGSFRPDPQLCPASEFHDFMHSSARCLARLSERGDY